MPLAWQAYSFSPAFAETSLRETLRVGRLCRRCLALSKDIESLLAKLQNKCTLTINELTNNDQPSIANKRANEVMAVKLIN